jgi:hypothetical protein
MQLRPLAIGAIVLGLAATAVPAGAAPKPKPKPICFQITDEEGDGYAEGSGGLLSTPTLDILSADISSGKNEVSGIIRLKSAKVEGDNAASLGVRWGLVYIVQGVKYAFYARYTGYSEGANPKWYGGMTVGGTGVRSDPEAVFKRDGNNLLWSVSRKAVSGLKKANQFLIIENATSGTLTFGADAASPKPGAKYLDRAPHCLPSK